MQQFLSESKIISERMRLSLCLSLVLTACLVECDVISDHEVDRVLNETIELYRSLWVEKPEMIERRSQHRRLYRKGVNPMVIEYGTQAAAFRHAAQIIADKYGVKRSEAERHLAARSDPRKDFNPNVICGRALSCPPDSPYRAPDGMCNNRNDPTLGMAIVQFDRILASAYDDGVSSLRNRSVNGEALKSPREISTLVHQDVNTPHSTITHMVVIFGQFLDHDITSTPEFQNYQCCLNKDFPECMPIDVPPTDSWYKQFRVTCIDVGRSIPSCGSGKREQINQVTAYLDGSQVYGSSLTELNNLRHGNGYQLLTDSNTQLLPKDFDARDCGIPNQNIICFKAGDNRVNENPALTSMHTLWMREHNRVAQILRNNNPSWATETVFQESRRIVIAQLQNIVFNEFLPVVLGPTTMTAFDLNLPSPGIFSTYDSTVRGNVFSEFATAAFRFAHTLIQNNYNMAGGGSVVLENNFQNPQVIYQSAANIDRLLMGGTQQNAQAYDQFISQALTRHLLQMPGERHGKDLMALNVQRGRDHGLPPWVHYRSFCRLPVPKNFNDLLPIVGSSDKVQRLQNAYFSVADIDLWTGGISEQSVSGGVVGPTFACIQARQFQRLFKGDRFFFTHGGQRGSFRSTQLTTLRARTLGSVMCDNNQPIVTDTQASVFLLGQTRVPCSQQPKLNLAGWIPAAV